MADLSDIIHILPVMKSGDELLSALEVLPEYDEVIRETEVPVRLMALSDLYRIYDCGSLFHDHRRFYSRTVCLYHTALVSAENDVTCRGSSYTQGAGK